MLGEGREEGETEYTLRTVVAEQTDRWAKGYGGEESMSLLLLQLFVLHQVSQ